MSSLDEPTPTEELPLPWLPGPWLPSDESQRVPSGEPGLRDALRRLEALEEAIRDTKERPDSNGRT